MKRTTLQLRIEESEARLAAAFKERRAVYRLIGKQRRQQTPPPGNSGAGSRRAPRRADG